MEAGKNSTSTYPTVVCPSPASTLVCLCFWLQLSASQQQVSTLQTLVQQLTEKQDQLEQQRQELQDACEQQRADVDRTTRLLHGEDTPAKNNIVQLGNGI